MRLTGEIKAIATTVGIGSKGSGGRGEREEGTRESAEPAQPACQPAHRYQPVSRQTNLSTNKPTSTADREIFLPGKKHTTIQVDLSAIEISHVA